MPITLLELELLELELLELELLELELLELELLELELLELELLELELLELELLELELELLLELLASLTRRAGIAATLQGIHAPSSYRASPSWATPVVIHSVSSSL